MQRLFGMPRREEESEWLSVSDLMAGLMVIFLFIAIFYVRSYAEDNRKRIELQLELEEKSEQLETQNLRMAEDNRNLVELQRELEEKSGRLEMQNLRQAEDNKKLVELQRELEEKSDQLETQNLRMAEVAFAWQEREQQIFEALLREFREDLPGWNAEIEEATLLIRFKSPEVLFELGDDAIRPEFQTILRNFFPRYVEVLKPFRDALDELRIEGHTSSEWYNASFEQAYFENMRLSQDRTRTVLEYVLGLNAVSDERAWLRQLLTANGLSSSRRVLTAKGIEDPERSRRVEFRVKTTVRSEIVKILEAAR